MFSAVDEVQYIITVVLLFERNIHTSNMTNLAIIQFTVLITLIIKFNLGIQLNYRNGHNIK
jgi:ABC-type proline/glycine betaine transport system permease subunit